jgi:transcriptional regulator with XRE-family HTH domain
VAKTIGEVLRQARRDAGLSTRDIERLTGMSTASLSQIETGIRKDPGFRTVLRIARAIGISMEEVALRLDGQGTATGGASKRTVPAALALLTKAHQESMKSAATLESAIATLGGKKKPRGGAKS